MHFGTNRRKRFGLYQLKRFQHLFGDQFYLMEAGAFAVSNVDNTRDKTSLLCLSIGYATKYDVSFKLYTLQSF
jgi:hypothetical protein